MVSGYIREYGGVVWTDHALDRLRRRRLSQDDVLGVLKNPDKTFPAKGEGSVKFIKTVSGRRVHTVATLNEDKRWVVVSVWVRGEEDKPFLIERLLGWLLGMVWRLIKTVIREIGVWVGMGKKKK